MSLRGDEIVREPAHEGEGDDESTDGGTEGAVRGAVVPGPVQGEGVVPGAGVVVGVHGDSSDAVACGVVGAITVAGGYSHGLIVGRAAI